MTQTSAARLRRSRRGARASPTALETLARVDGWQPLRVVLGGRTPRERDEPPRIQLRHLLRGRQTGARPRAGRRGPHADAAHGAPRRGDQQRPEPQQRDAPRDEDGMLAPVEGRPAPLGVAVAAAGETIVIGWANSPPLSIATMMLWEPASSSAGSVMTGEE